MNLDGSNSETVQTGFLLVNEIALVDAACFVDCDADSALTIQDFTCFQNAFALGDLAHADCDGSGTLDILDFTCFQDAFAGGDLVKADCDRSGMLTILDWMCFQNGFALGCE